MLQDEPESQRFAAFIETANIVIMSVVNVVEASLVIESRYGVHGSQDLDGFLSLAGVELIDVDRRQGQVARTAFSRLGKGRFASSRFRGLLINLFVIS